MSKQQMFYKRVPPKMFLWKTNSSFGPCILQNWATVSLTNTLQKFNPYQTLALSWRNPHHIWTSPLIWTTNQWSAFYMIGTSFRKVLKLNLFQTSVILCFSVFRTAWKVSKFEVFSGLCFPALGLNTVIYSVTLLF